MKRTTLTTAIVILGMSLGCAKPPSITSLAVGQEVELFNGRDLTGWNILTKEYFDMPGKVSVKDGAMILGSGSELTGVQWGGEMLRTDFTVSLEARRVDGSDFFCGLTFPVGKGYVSLILGGWGGMVVGLSNVDDMAANENATTQAIEFVKNKWYSIEVTVSEGYVRVWLDDEKIIEQVIKGKRFDIWPQQELLRPLGVSTYCTVGAIRRFAVKRLVPSEVNLKVDE
ncbi:MAG: DUF1080 domain-containing protein [Phycisphaerae bacterium]|jgi:hypothetical protein|nr:DUF1080 domain-containing protein [Phycisphaerae bacterium]